MRTAAEMVTEAKERIENLTVDETARELKCEAALLVDIREPAERARSGFIAGAVEAPRGMLEFWADPTSPYHRDEFDPSRRLILYCTSGSRSALAGATLRDLGYERVAHIEGGLNAWKDAGRPVWLTAE